MPAPSGPPLGEHPRGPKGLARCTGRPKEATAPGAHRRPPAPSLVALRRRCASGSPLRHLRPAFPGVLGAATCRRGRRHPLSPGFAGRRLRAKRGDPGRHHAVRGRPGKRCESGWPSGGAEASGASGASPRGGRVKERTSTDFAEELVACRPGQAAGRRWPSPSSVRPAGRCSLGGGAERAAVVVRRPPRPATPRRTCRWLRRRGARALWVVAVLTARGNVRRAGSVDRQRGPGGR